MTGRLVALGCFISRFMNRLKPLFTTLRGASQAEWNEECDRAFVEIKQYLTEPPILVSSKTGDTLYLYLAASDTVVSATLFKECGDAKLRLVTGSDPDTLPGFPGWYRLVKSHCTIPREYPMKPHFKKESKHMH